MIAATLFFALKTLKIDYFAAMWEIPLAVLFLMRYQSYYEDRNGKLMSLGDKEEIDRIVSEEKRFP